MSYFGIDIGSETIKIVELRRDGENLRLIGAGMAKTPAHGLSSESAKDLTSLAEAIKKLKNDAGIQADKAFSSLPESSVFTRVIDLPVMKEEEIEQALKWELEEVVPLPLKEVNYDWQIIKTLPDKISVLVAVAPKVLIEKFLRIFELADLQLAAVETEVLSINRALSASAEQKAKLIIDFGSSSADIVVSKSGEIMVTRSIPTAGKAITRAISTGLTIEEETAEEYKKTYGLDKTQFEGKLDKMISPLLGVIVGEVKKSIGYCREEKKEEVKLIILTGGSANLPGLTELITKETGIEVQIANPFAQISLDEKMVTNLRKYAPNFVVAVGLAMREE